VLAALGIGEKAGRLSDWQALALGVVQGATELPADLVVGTPDPAAVDGELDLPGGSRGVQQDVRLSLSTWGR
jgi:hypothetical protein